MSNVSRMRILCVDDEPNILHGLKRQLIKHFDVTIAVGAVEGLKIFKESEPFPIVVSDLKMPQMDGVTFLGKIRQENPDTIRILLTGQADLNSAIAAVNEGQIFRFLIKPCPTEDLLKSLKAAQDQYNLVTAEKVLLEQTLQGSIKTLLDILILANPELFSMVNRLKAMLNRFTTQLNIQEPWPLAVATMLSQIGIITLPDETIHKLRDDEPLDPEEKKMMTQLPQVVEKLLSHIPRLEPVREILLFQEKHYDGGGFPVDNVQGEAIPLGARILKILLDYDRLLLTDQDPILVLDIMFGRAGWYDEALLKQFSAMLKVEVKQSDVRDIPAIEMQTGMILAEDLCSPKNIPLVRKGIIVTPALLERILNIGKQAGIKEPIKVIIPEYFKWLKNDS